MAHTVDVDHFRKVATALLRGADPYEYQLRVADRLLGGRSVLLQAPTGAGKTIAAVLPFLYAKSHGIPFADRLIYAVPMRTLVTALYREARTLIEAIAPGLKVTVQTGSQPDDPYLEGDIVFTTIDQLLSAYVGSPVSLPGNAANIVGAATIGSYVVFDEFHLLEPDLALSTAIDLAARLSELSRVLLMSATVTAGAAELICRRARAAFESVPDDEVLAMASQRTKVRRLNYVDQPLTAAHILDQHRQRSIAVVNTVSRAQRLFAELRDLWPDQAERIRLLHARFLPVDRSAVEDWALRVFREGSTEKGILIGTQAVEVGLNVSAQVLHTDLAPAAAVFQRAGRCARFAGESGDVYVYALPTDDSGRMHVAPYAAVEREAIANTAEGLAGRSGRRCTYADERAVTEEAYGAYDRDRLDAVLPVDRAERVADAMRTADPSAVRQLIRDADTVSLAVHHDPASIPPQRRLATFSIARETWRSFASRLQEADQPIWLLRAPQRLEDGPTAPSWQRCADRRLVGAASWVCVSPRSASYDPALGLQLDVAGLWESRAESVPARVSVYRNRLEAYQRHIERTLGQVDGQRDGYRIARRRLAQCLGVPEEALERLVRLAAALHDVAKLAQGWQDAAWRWQQAVHPGQPSSGFIAHTDRDLTDGRQRSLSRDGAHHFPGHAAESAFAALPTIQAVVKQALADVEEDVRDSIKQAMFCAIARHHGGEMRSLEDFVLPTSARTEAARTLGELGVGKAVFQDRPNSVTRNQYPTYMINPSKDSAGFLLYWYVSRRLRRADQLATAEGAA